MSLIPLMKLRLAQPEHVVDLSRIPGLKYVTESAGVVRIGAMSTHHDIESSATTLGRTPLLSETAGRIGDLQVRNMGTIGGSIAHADPLIPEGQDENSDLYASGDYRRQLARVHGARALSVALSRAS